MAANGTQQNEYEALFAICRFCWLIKQKATKSTAQIKNLN